MRMFAATQNFDLYGTSNFPREWFLRVKLVEGNGLSW